VNVNETNEELQPLTICDVSYVAQTLFSVLWAHIAIHNPFERDQWTFRARWFERSFGGGFRH
jgi:hypothetical protein